MGTEPGREEGRAAGAPAPVRPFTEPESAKIAVENVSKTFSQDRRDVLALSEVSLSLGEGEFVCIVGPSGCGKSTLLALIAGLDFPDAGTVKVDGAQVTGPGRDRMMMFQEAALFPWRDVLGNVEFGLELKPGVDRRARREVALHYIRMVGLEDFQHAYIHELSGGMRQRVALARSLAPNPKVLLMDEPFAALDALTREQLYQDLQKIWVARKKTIVFVTHNVREAVCLGDRVIVFSPHPGRVQEQFEITLPRPRDINGVDLARIAGEITRALRSHLDGHPA